MKFSRVRIFVLSLLFIGIAIHIFGLFDIQTGDASFTAHILMFASDVIALVGLFTRKQWGYWFATGLFVYAVGSQTYWTIEAMIKHYDMFIVQATTAMLCMIGLYFLIRYKPRFLKQKSAL